MHFAITSVFHWLSAKLLAISTFKSLFLAISLSAPVSPSFSPFSSPESGGVLSISLSLSAPLSLPLSLSLSHTLNHSSPTISPLIHPQCTSYYLLRREKDLIKPSSWITTIIQFVRVIFALNSIKSVNLHSYFKFISCNPFNFIHQTFYINSRHKYHTQKIFAHFKGTNPFKF